MDIMGAGGFLLTNCKAIALNGYNKVKEFHNYKVRLNDIFKIAGLI